ncbi:MAG: hypothetical protein QOF86_3718 [Baekduia sp.]|nr:hypothetical protein [Baekduia sp.]
MSAQLVTAPAYVEIAPPPALRPFVERLWVHRIEGPPPPEGRRLLPDGRIHMVWIAGAGVQIAGPQTRYAELPALERMLAFGACFHPGAAPSLLRTPASAFVDRHVALDAVDPRRARRLDDRLGDAADVAGAIEAFTDELTRSLRAAPARHPIVEQVVGLLDDHRVTVANAADQVFVSERALQRRFVEAVGYGPKTLHRVLRFQRFLRALELPIPLAGAAAAAGYADQSHLSRETRRLAGLTPQQLTEWTH